MPKIDFGVAVAFATQTAEGTYDSGLDEITTSLADTDGLVVGDPGSGVRESGLTLVFGRSRADRAFIGSSLTRPITDFLRREVTTFTFAFPFVGNRVTVSGAPADADAVPIVGIDALLEGVGVVGTAWGTGVGHSYLYGSPNPISALVYLNGNRYELLDCRVSSLAITYNKGGLAIATASLQVGSVKDASVAALPTTLDPGEQATVSAPVCEALANTWQDLRGFDTLVVTLAPEIQDFGDMNAPAGSGGIVKEKASRLTTVAGTLYVDDTGGAGYEQAQLIEAVEGNLDPLSFQVGANMADTFPALAHQVVVPLPELVSLTPTNIGSKAGATITLEARGAALGSGNDELEIIFR